jgi:5-methylcytosine-specific restriction endonuclease McrA
MTRRSSPPRKGRLQQQRQQQIAHELRGLKHIRTINPARHDWLVRHVERQGGRCIYCGIPLLLSAHGKQADRQASLDHIVALAHGGADSEANTAAACEPCNKAKADKTAQAFRMSEFLIARKAHAATVPLHQRKPLVVVRKPVRKTVDHEKDSRRPH